MGVTYWTLAAARAGARQEDLFALARGCRFETLFCARPDFAGPSRRGSVYIALPRIAAGRQVTWGRGPPARATRVASPSFGAAFAAPAISSPSCRPGQPGKIKKIKHLRRERGEQHYRAERPPLGLRQNPPHGRRPRAAQRLGPGPGAGCGKGAGESARQCDGQSPSESGGEGSSESAGESAGCGRAQARRGHGCWPCPHPCPGCCRLCCPGSCGVRIHYGAGPSSRASSGATCRGGRGLGRSAPG